MNSPIPGALGEFVYNRKRHVKCELAKGEFNHNRKRHVKIELANSPGTPGIGEFDVYISFSLVGSDP